MSGDMLQASTKNLAGCDSEKPEMASIASVIESSNAAFVVDHDPDIFKAKSLLEQLEQTAKGHGYHSFSEMQRRLVEDRDDLNSESRYQLLKRFAPALHEAGGYATKRVLPGVDATGLLAIQEIAKSVARLIRVLLVGYTHEEREELADRMKAERAVEVESAMAQRESEISHHAVLNQMAAMAHALSLDAKVGP